MNLIQFTARLDDDGVLKSVSIDFNNTDQLSNSTLLKNISIAILKSLKLNADDVAVQDLLTELEIKTTK